MKQKKLCLLLCLLLTLALAFSAGAGDGGIWMGESYVQREEKGYSRTEMEWRIGIVHKSNCRFSCK